MKSKQQIQIKKHKDGRMFLYVNGSLKTIDSRPSMILATLDTLGYNTKRLTFSSFSNEKYLTTEKS